MANETIDDVLINSELDPEKQEQLKKLVGKFYGVLTRKNEHNRTRDQGSI